MQQFDAIGKSSTVRFHVFVPIILVMHVQSAENKPLYILYYYTYHYYIRLNSTNGYTRSYNKANVYK